MSQFNEIIEFAVDVSEDNVRAIEEIVTANPDLKVETVDDAGVGAYRATCAAGFEQGRVPLVLISTFMRLDGFVLRYNELIPLAKKGGIGLAGNGGQPEIERVCTIRCVFKSNVPYFKLAQQFNREVANGVLKPGAGGSGEYTALVYLNIEGNEGTPEAVETMLRRAFEAEAEDRKTAVKFFVDEDNPTSEVVKSPKEATDGQ